MGLIMSFPHCDARVLHKPGDCEFCDNHPDWQELRQIWKIGFTGAPRLADQRPCPAEVERGLESINSWGGNQASPKDGVVIGYANGLYPVKVKRSEWLERIRIAKDELLAIFRGDDDATA